MTTLATLRTLHATIGSALDDIEKAYNAQGLDFPSPDVPLYRNINPEDPAEKLTADPAVARAASFAVAASGQLVNTLQHPFAALFEGASGYLISAGIQLLEESHTVDILRVAGPHGLHVDELARKIDEVRSGKGPVSKPLDPTPLSHILRLLAAHQVIREVRPNVFANARISALLDTGKTPEQIRDAPEKKYDDTDGIAALAPLVTNEGFRSMAYLTEWLLHPRDGTNAPDPFKYAYNTDEGMYAWLERPENSLRLRQVGRGMAAAEALEGSMNITQVSAFPWTNLPKDALVVDVGGGIGSVTVRIAEAHPHLRHIVQDRPNTVAMAPKLWGDRHKDLFSSGRVTFQAQDFFTPQPTAFQVPGIGEVKHASVFILTRVTHNWGDDECRTILKHLRAAAGPDTKLLIVDQILPLACADEPSVAFPRGSLAPANSPLLHNLGKAYAISYHMDLLMYATMGAKERTLTEMTEIVSPAGWKIAAVNREEGGVSTYTTLVPV